MTGREVFGLLTGVVLTGPGQLGHWLADGVLADIPASAGWLLDVFVPVSFVLHPVTACRLAC
ncbi:hypothetical protein AB0940_29585 [Streptomyces sp. NPDC006656]|uniref:hypothetical protein n=1 Tax=Streptomyces sp. NPDC006656 TaxID=3156899 RepID=UPI0034517492